MADDDAYYFAADDAGGAGFDACDACGGRCVPAASGDVVCVECGTQSQDVRHATQEAEGLFSDFSRRQRARAAPRARAASPRLAAAALNTRDFLRGAQAVLRAQARAVAARVGGVPRARAGEREGDAAWPRAVRGAWRRYVARWAGAPLPPALLVGARLALSSDGAYLAVAAARRVPPPPHVPLAPPLLLSFLLLAARRLGAPLRAADLARAAASGDVPFLDAARALPAPLRALVAGAAGWFAPAALPAAAEIERGAAALARALYGAPLPPPNAALATARAAAALRLPAGAAPLAAALAALDAHDARYAAAFGARCGVAAARRAACARGASADAGVAAALFCATRLVGGWEAWVDAALAPGTVGGAPAAAPRALPLGASAAQLLRAPLGALAAHVRFLAHGALTGGNVVRGGAALPADEAFGALLRVAPSSARVRAALATRDEAADAARRDAAARAALAADGGGDDELMQLLAGAAPRAAGGKGGGGKGGGGKSSGGGGGGGDGGGGGGGDGGGGNDDDNDGGGGGDDDGDEEDPHVTVTRGRRNQAPGWRAARGGDRLWPERLLGEVAGVAAALSAAGEAAAARGGGDAADGGGAARDAAAAAAAARRFALSDTWTPAVADARAVASLALSRATLRARDAALLAALADDCGAGEADILAHVFVLELLLIAYTPVAAPAAAAAAEAAGAPAGAARPPKRRRAPPDSE
jgi:uncharacterized membrane protein YgcG